jgi:hypothetical protein
MINDMKPSIGPVVADSVTLYRPAVGAGQEVKPLARPAGLTNSRARKRRKTPRVATVDGNTAQAETGARRYWAHLRDA